MVAISKFDSSFTSHVRGGLQANLIAREKSAKFFGWGWGERSPYDSRIISDG